ncbi:MAG: metal-dependent hydrolase [Candidatus Bathyarchaeia archaeon]
MPFTPFHLGPALFFGLALLSIFDLPTFLIASVIPYIEPFCVIYFHVYGYPLHGFFHSYLGASFLAFLAALIVYPFRDMLKYVMEAFRISQQKASFKKLLFTSFVGVYFHVFLDSFLYGEMMLFYPLHGNPFVNVLDFWGSYSLVYGFCGLSFLSGVFVYIFRSTCAKT